MLTAKQLRDELRRLLAGPHTRQAEEEARVLLASYEARQDAPQPPQRPAAPPVVLTPAEAADAAEKAKWRRLVQRSPMSRVVYGGPSGSEPASVAENEQKTYLRGQSPWR